MTNDKFSSSPTGAGMAVKMEPEFQTTGKTIEESMPTTIGDLRDAIIEAAVDLVNRTAETEGNIYGRLDNAVDAYHARLRQDAREGK